MAATCTGFGWNPLPPVLKPHPITNVPNEHLQLILKNGCKFSSRWSGLVAWLHGWGWGCTDSSYHGFRSLFLSSLYADCVQRHSCWCCGVHIVWPPPQCKLFLATIFIKTPGGAKVEGCLSNQPRYRDHLFPQVGSCGLRGSRRGSKVSGVYPSN